MHTGTVRQVSAFSAIALCSLVGEHQHDMFVSTICTESTGSFIDVSMISIEEDLVANL